MFVYQKNFFTPCIPCTREIFDELATCSKTVGSIETVRYYQRQIDALPAELTPEQEQQKKEWEQMKSAAKKGIPALVFQAYFIETKSKKGYTGTWRKNAAAVLNGLYMLDVDHIENGDKANDILDKARRFYGSHILLAFFTASGHGLKFVAKADTSVGNIADNQRWLAARLGCQFDEACKDAARLSFCPAKSDIIYINDEIFDYDNEKFENLYGAGYRDGSLSRSDAARGHGDAGACRGGGDNAGGGKSDIPCDEVRAELADEAGAEGKEKNEHDAEKMERQGEDKDPSSGTRQLHSGDNVVSEFGGVAYTEIIRKYCETVGLPQVGGRHQWLLKLAKDIRYICDFDKAKVVQVMMLCTVAQEVAKERGESEITGIAEAACSYRYYTDYPKAMKETLRVCGIKTELGKTSVAGETIEKPKIDYAYWAKRIMPLLEEGDLYSDATAGMPEATKLGGVLAAGAMYGTYLTRCSFPFYDGKNYRFSYIVYVIGHAASGKSFVIDMGNELMSSMKMQDDNFRQMEQDYKEQKERMTTSSKDARGQAPKRPHYPIRYVPSTISNAKLYQRLQDAVDAQDETLHLHLFTLESELATALRVQVGSWAGKLDLELKSWQNEDAGVDYANEQSANGVIQVNWNQVISGTMDALRRKMRGGAITDGYITRMALWIMPDTDYRMIAKNYDSVVPDDDRETARKARVRRRIVAFDSLRCLMSHCRRLSDFCYDWCAEQCETAQMEEDACVEYFRKRIPIYMMRYTLPRVIDRNIDKFQDGYLKNGETIEVLDSDIEFARVIGDYLMFISIYQWGEAYLEAVDEDNSLRKPRLRKSKFAQTFAKLPNEFSFADISAYYRTEGSARTSLSHLVKSRIIEKIAVDRWRKLKRSIDEIVVENKN